MELHRDLRLLLLVLAVPFQKPISSVVNVFLNELAVSWWTGASTSGLSYQILATSLFLQVNKTLSLQNESNL